MIGICKGNTCFYLSCHIPVVSFAGPGRWRGCALGVGLDVCMPELSSWNYFYGMLPWKGGDDPYYNKRFD